MSSWKAFKLDRWVRVAGPIGIRVNVAHIDIGNKVIVYMGIRGPFHLAWYL